MGIALRNIIYVLTCYAIVLKPSIAFPDHGQTIKTYNYVPSAYFSMQKSLYAGSLISLSVSCEPSAKNETTDKVIMKVGWMLRETNCLEDYFGPDIYQFNEALRILYDCPMTTTSSSKVRYITSDPVIAECSPREQIEFNMLPFPPLSEEFQGPLPLHCLQNNSEFSLVATSNDKKNVKDNEKPLDIPLTLALKQSYKREAPDEGQKSKSTATAKTVSTKQDQKNEVLENSVAVINNTLKPKTSLILQKSHKKHGSSLAVADTDGIYLFVLKIESLSDDLMNLTVEITMKGDYGYLSAADYPLLLFYGVMCGVYSLYAFMWLVVSGLQWRDLLRIQFWIGGVILLGLIEKAFLYAEYQSVNYSGDSVQGAVIYAEFLSCMKRTLARMLVIVVSLGFGIVKPRLGPTLQRVICVGVIYFLFSVIEGLARVLKPKLDPSNQALMASIPLAIIDSAICWWIFSSLVKTTRTLRLRRNLVKLSLYRHFTNTLIFAVLASVAYMVWSIHNHRLVTCVTDWKGLWIDEAFWHMLFSLILLVIMVLWRPTNNNQRYAFTPLLDAMDDDNEDDFDESVPIETGLKMKMRPSRNQSSVSPKQSDPNVKHDDDLKWVDENIPVSLTDVALPSMLDSDEEIMTAKFERSKME